MDTDSLIKEVLGRKSWLLKESSNTQISPSLLDLHISNQANREYALNYIYSKDVARHHKNNLIYIHDLHSVFRPYCNGLDARIFLLDGLRFPHCKSSPAKHFGSAVYQSMAYMFYSQLFFAGAQAIDYYNWFLAPYLHHDKLKYGQVRQIIQGFVYQLNQSNRTGAQSAFTNIGLRIKCPSYLEGIGCEPAKVVYAGKYIKANYADFEKGARLIYRAFMDVMASGDGDGKPFTFPIITTAITKDFDWNDSLVNATMRAAANTGAPYFFNLTTPYLDEKYTHAMCCRLLVSHSGGVWNAGGIGSGSNKVVTINLPRLALTSKDAYDLFDKLDHELNIARKALLEGNRIVEKSLNQWKLLPLLRMKTRDNALYYNFKERKLTFGIIGMDDCLHNLMGEGITTKEGKNLALLIVMHINERIEEFSRKDKVQYTLEQTPAESASHKLALKDKIRFKQAHVQGRGKSLYYSNSTHVPYSKDVSLFDKIDIEAAFHPYFSGGVISHIWMGESKPDMTAMKKLVKRMAETNLAYFTFSPDFTICINEHTSRGKRDRCPRCGSKNLDYMSRIVGFFTKTSNWNIGKKQEYSDRKRYKIK